ncbi:MAG TPA: hypothetical protein DCS12_04135 [Clostridiales bacterium]|nr:hypothetical protein [Clostridiales bacterium]
MIKKYLFKNTFLKRNLIKLYEYYRYITICLPRNLLFKVSAYCRMYGIRVGEYQKLKKLHNAYLGKSCFIIGTGPSLLNSDLEKIKGLLSFSVNSIVLSLDKTDWRPTFYGIQDSTAYNILREKIIENQFSGVFCGISTPSLTPKMQEGYIAYPLYLYDHDIQTDKHFTEFSSNAYKKVCDGYTITYSLMQIAYYMGFREIVLLGIDCDYVQGSRKNHIVEYTKTNNGNAVYLMRESYKVAREFADKHNLKIYNASRNPKLDVFEKIDLDQYLKCKNYSQEI